MNVYFGVRGFPAGTGQLNAWKTAKEPFDQALFGGAVCGIVAISISPQ